MKTGLILEHRRTNQQLKRSAIISFLLTGGTLIGLCLVALFVFRDLMIIPFMVFVLAIFMPVLIFGSVKLWRQNGEFRSWLSEETIGQEIPVIMGDEISFEVEVSGILKLYKITPVSDARTQWVIEMIDGRRFNLSNLYSNKPDQYFKRLIELRPELSVENLQRIPLYI